VSQISRPIDPFGEVNVRPQPNGSVQVVATILMEPDVEGARCGLALDGSSSMQRLYGAGGAVSPILARSSASENVVEPVARAMSAYLARFSSSGTVNLVYWSCSPDGGGLEEIGEFSEPQARAVTVAGPRRLSWGRKTKLLPPVRHFLDGVFRLAPWSICVFVTDGRVDDLDEVKQFCWQHARQVAARRRPSCKLVLIGLGEEVDEAQMEELDDMFEGSGLRDHRGDPIALWDHKLAREMRHLQEVFAEVVSEKVIVAARGRILDPAGRIVADYSDGMPALLRFSLPRGCSSFTLEVAGHRITQPLCLPPRG